MTNRKLTLLASMLLTFLLCTFTSMSALAQIAGQGVDPDAKMLDDFETGDYAKWKPKPGARGEKVTFELMNADNGDIVKFGKYALKVNIDFTGAQPNQTLTGQVSPATLTITGNDGKSGAKRLGMWAYATPGVKGMWFRISTRKNGATSGVTNTDLASKIDWTGWKYVQCNLPADHEFHPDGIRFLTLKSYENYYANGYVILDNIRVINQSFSEDLTAPTITKLTANDAAVSGTFTTNTFKFDASFTDSGSNASGINHNSVYMTIDGDVFKTGSNGFTINETENTVSLTGIRLSNGTHNIALHIEDNFGHISQREGTIIVDATGGNTTTVTLASDAQAFVGNPFELKINTDNSKDIKELDIVLEINNFGTVDPTTGVKFAPSATGSTFDYNPRNGYLTLNLKNDIQAEQIETLATINVDISKNSNPTDVLRFTPVSAKATFADNSTSLFSLFNAFSKDVTAAYDYSVIKRVVGAPGEVLATDIQGNPLAGANVFALNADMTSIVSSAVTGADGIATGMSFTDKAQAVNIYVEKDGKYSYTRLIRTLNPLLTAAPTYIRSGASFDPKTTKTITWMAHPVLAAEPSLMKYAKKDDGESSFIEVVGNTKYIEYNAVVSNGTTKGSSVTINNLEPGTTYIYQVGDGINWSPTMEFTTVTNATKFSFSAFGDLQATSNDAMGRFIAAAKTIEEQPVKPFFNLNVGDIVDSDDRYDFYSYYGHLFNQRTGFANIDMISAYGNHEYMGNADADNIKFSNGHHTVLPSPKYDSKVVGTGTFAVEYENMIVLGLDWAHKGGASPNEIMAEQAKWMDEVLSNTTKTWKIVTLHYPIYPSESTPGAQGIFGPILDKHGVQMVFCGHGHTFERVQVYNGQYLMPISDRRYFTPVIGGTIHFQLGDMTRTTANGRWILCEVDGKKMDVIVRDANNEIVTRECFTLYASEIEEYKVNYSTIDNNGTITATVDGNAITSGDNVTEGKDIIFTATPSSGYSIKEWKLNGVVVNDTETTFTVSSIKEASTVTVEFQEGSGVDDTFKSTINIFPSPFTSVVNVIGAEGCTLNVIDIAGVVVHTQEISNENGAINLDYLLAGVYFFHVEKDNQSKIIKVIKK